MLKSVQGTYRNGKVELLETPSEVVEAEVIVTFLPPRGEIDLRERGIDEGQAASLRAQLESFAEDWDRPEMDVYNDL